MGGVKAHVGIGMQGSGSRDPPFEDRSQMVPSRFPSLAATAQYLPPQPAQTLPESSQHYDVSRHSMIAVIAFHDPFQPLAYDPDRFMHLPAQLLLDALKLR